MLIPRLYETDNELPVFNGGPVVCFFSRTSYAALLKLLPLLEYETLYNTPQILGKVRETLISEIVDGEMTGNIQTGLEYLANVIAGLKLSDYVNVNTCCDGATDTTSTAEAVETAETDAGQVGSTPIIQTGGVFDVQDCLAANVTVDAIYNIARGMYGYIDLYGRLNDRQVAEVISDWLTRVGVQAAFVGGAFVFGETVSGGTAAIVGGMLVATVQALVWATAKFSDAVQPALGALVDHIENNRDTAVCAVYNGTDNWIIDLVGVYGQAVAWIVATVVRGIALVTEQIGLTQFTPTITVDCSACVSASGWSYLAGSGWSGMTEYQIFEAVRNNGTQGAGDIVDWSQADNYVGYYNAVVYDFVGVAGGRIYTHGNANKALVHLWTLDQDNMPLVLIGTGQVGAYGDATFAFDWSLPAEYDGMKLALLLYSTGYNDILSRFEVMTQ